MSPVRLLLCVVILCGFASNVNADSKECINYIIIDTNKRCLSPPVDPSKIVKTKPSTDKERNADNKDDAPGDVTENPNVGTEESVGDIRTNLLLEQKPIKE